jgi:hypothetical protein
MSACAPHQAEFEVWRHIKMNRSNLMRRLSVVAALAIVLALAAGAPTLQAQPEAGTISTGAGVQVWNGHNCPANVPVNIANLGTGLGGYETKIAWPAGRFNNTPANVVVTLTTYLAVGTRVNSLGNIPPNPPAVTQPLKAVVGDTVKFADFSYGSGNPPGNMANGQLATVSLLPTATCGPAALTVSGAPDTQLVDIYGDPIALTGQTGSSVNVYSQWDTDGSGGNVDVGDIIGVINNLGNDAGPAGGCTSSYYRYDTDLSGGNIDVGDIIQVINHLGATCQ